MAGRGQPVPSDDLPKAAPFPDPAFSLPCTDPRDAAKSPSPGGLSEPAAGHLGCSLADQFWPIAQFVEDEIEGRRAVATIYEREITDLPGLDILAYPEDIERNYSYFPILVDEDSFGLSRDEVYDWLRSCNVFARKYFYPLCSQYPIYSELPSADPSRLPIALRASQRVLCLPIYGDLGIDSAKTITQILWEAHHQSQQVAAKTIIPRSDTPDGPQQS